MCECIPQHYATDVSRQNPTSTGTTPTATHLVDILSDAVGQLAMEQSERFYLVERYEDVAEEPFVFTLYRMGKSVNDGAYIIEGTQKT